MALTAAEIAARDRAAALNSNRYDATTNHTGLAGLGYQVNWTQGLNDTATLVGAAVREAQAAVDAASDADGSAGAAASSATKAGQWAENGEDVAVEPGLFSAKHYSIKAAAAAAAAALFDPSSYYTKTAADARYLGLAGGTMTGAIAMGAKAITNVGQSNTPPNALTFGSTVTPNLALGGFHTLTATGTFTLAAPSNPVAGQGFVIRIAQDATGSRLWSLASFYKFTAATVPALSTAANAVDWLLCHTDYDGGSAVCQLLKDARR